MPGYADQCRPHDHANAKKRHSVHYSVLTSFMFLVCNSRVGWHAIPSVFFFNDFRVAKETESVADVLTLIGRNHFLLLNLQHSDTVCDYGLISFFSFIRFKKTIQFRHRFQAALRIQREDQYVYQDRLAVETVLAVALNLLIARYSFPKSTSLFHEEPVR